MSIITLSCFSRLLSFAKPGMTKISRLKKKLFSAENWLLLVIVIVRFPRAEKSKKLKMEKRSISIVLYSARSVEKKTLLRLLMIGYKKKIKQNRKDLMFARLAECSHIFFLNNTMFVF